MLSEALSQLWLAIFWGQTAVSGLVKQSVLLLGQLEQNVPLSEACLVGVEVLQVDLGAAVGVVPVQHKELIRVVEVDVNIENLLDVQEKPQLGF